MRLPLLLLALGMLPACQVTPTAGSTHTVDADTSVEVLKQSIYRPGNMKPVDSQLKVRVGETAPDFTLPSVSGKKVSLSDYRGKKNVLLTFAPAAFTPICSMQWPGYDLASDIFAKHNTSVVGISTDNIPSLHSWTSQLGNVGFPVLSDFWPHGTVCSSYGILRSNGTAERALILVDKQGIIRWIEVHDINKRPPLEDIVAALEKLP